jgi:hypothetical protein
MAQNWIKWEEKFSNQLLFIMKKTNLILFAAAAWLLVGLLSCSKDNDPVPIADPIFGTWSSGSSDFFRISSAGRPLSFLEFGTEVFGLNEEGAERAAKAYFKQIVFGPIDLAQPSLSLKSNGVFEAFLESESAQGEWKFLNDQTVLQLVSGDSEVQIYDFEVLKLNSAELELRKRITISKIGEETPSIEVEVIIQLVK